MLQMAKDLFSFKNYASKQDCQRAHQLPPSILKQMRLKEYDHKNGLFLMDDGINYAAVYEIRGFPTEGRSESVFERYTFMTKQLMNLFRRYKLSDSPWVMQQYVTDEPNLFGWFDKLKNYASDEVKKTKLYRTYVEMARSHMKHMCQEGGAFVDPLTDNIFKGGERVTRLVFYRKTPGNKKLNRKKEILSVCRTLESKIKSFKSYGITCQRYTDKDMYHWLFGWFNKSVKGFSDTSEYLEEHPFIGAGNARPYGYNFIEKAFGTGVVSDEKQRRWKIGQTHHEYISCLGVSRAPDKGHITAEREISDGVYKALFDSMPEGTTIHITTIFQSEKEIDAELSKRMKSAGKSTSKDAELLLEEADLWSKEIARGNYLFPTQIGCYISAQDTETLEDRYETATSQLVNANFEVLERDYDPYGLDKFLKFLPANYDHKFDKYYYGSKLLALEHIARLSPIGYARNKGTGNPLFCDWNRMGEPVTFDTFADRKNNPHLLTLGMTGAGKSVRLANMMLAVMATYLPFLTIVDAGRSFEFLVDFFEYMGLSVNRIVIERKGVPDISLNPFMETKQLVAQVKEMENLQEMVRILQDTDDRVEKELNEQSNTDFSKKLFIPKDEEDEEDKEEEEQRDYMAEFQLAALLMIGNGKEPEEVGITPDHRFDLMESIVECAKYTVDELKKDQMIPSDLVKYMSDKASELEKSNLKREQDKAERLFKLANYLSNFIKMPTNAMYFDRPGEPLKNADITYFEMGIWKDDKDANIAPRSLAFITLMNRTMAQAEQRQKSDRFSLFFGDECHIVTTKKITAAPLIQCGKMSRKVGLYLWFATQNVKDFSENAAKMLSMFEFWICLEMPLSEFKQVTQFIEVSELEESLFKTVHNEKGKYTEGVILSKRHKLLIRCFPFKELLFLALNEQKEKNARVRVAKQYQCNEVEAAFIQAQLARGEAGNLEKARELLFVA